MVDPAAAESGTIWVTAASSIGLVLGAVGATVVGAVIAGKALDEADPQLMADEAEGAAVRRRRMTLEEAEAAKQQLQQPQQQAGEQQQK